MTHTPGPWRVRKDEPGKWLLKQEGNGGLYLFDLRECPGIAATDANARLIAAAPDLLAALRALITEWDRPREIPADPDWCDAIVGQARAAIAKAEGTS